jgi:hypothetical protein
MLTSRRGQEDDPSEYPPELIRGLFRAYLTDNTRREYGQMRESLLLFLLAERIDPDELVAACAVDPAHRVRSIIPHVGEDGILHLVYRAASGVR